MKKIVTLLAIAMLLLVYPVAAQNRQARNVDTFTSVSFRLPGKLYLRQGNTQKVELQGNKEILSSVETKVDGSRLIIHIPGKWNWKWNSDDDDLVVYITVKDLNGVSVGGSGDVIGESKFTTGDIDLNVSGSGSMKIEVESSGRMEANVSGSGELTVRGTAKNFSSDVSGSGRVIMNMQVESRSNFGISGSGKIEASGVSRELFTEISGSGRVMGSDFQVKRCEIRISGSGNVDIAVQDELDANISGSGSVNYRGNPAKVNSNSTGSGRVSKV